MRICVVNHTDIPDADVQRVLGAINLQLTDLLREWSVFAHVRLEGRRGHRPSQSVPELRGDALIYLHDGLIADAFGWHDANKYGIPYGIVHTRLSEEVGEPWSVTLSHEVLEVAMDPECNRLAAGPHPEHPTRDVFHWYELADAVQAATYAINGVMVSDFVLPAYFTVGEERGRRMSFLGADIESFGIAPGGYVGFYDPRIEQHTVRFADESAALRMMSKRKYAGARFNRHSPKGPVR